MSETARFALIIALTGAVSLAAVLVNRLSARLRVPAPVWMLAAAALAALLVPDVPRPGDAMVQQVVSVHVQQVEEECHNSLRRRIAVDLRDRFLE